MIVSSKCKLSSSNSKLDSFWNLKEIENWSALFNKADAEMAKAKDIEGKNGFLILSKTYSVT